MATTVVYHDRCSARKEGNKRSKALPRRFFRGFVE